MDTAAMPMDEWRTLPWKKYQRGVFQLQKRIYRASSRGDVKTVHNLQKLLTKSWSAKCLAVRRVTQDNQGKKTAGVDGMKSLLPATRLQLVKALNLKKRPKPVRRIWIPKPNTDEQRPLGIPIIRDRAAQTLVKMALEPQWEAQFEANSYGFRPGRSCHDAIGAIFVQISQKPKYVLDADISKCFDRINHQKLLEKLNTTPVLRRAIKGWLKAGVLEKGRVSPTKEGTPQGGSVSPLLANIALHGMAEAVSQVKGRPVTIRYADDFVVFHPDRECIEKAKERVEEWLAEMGLEVKPSKTQIVHTLRRTEEKPPGFDFLGFNIRQYPTQNTKRGYKTLIKPSKEAIRRHGAEIGKLVRGYKAAPQADMIKRLNLVTRGWARYYANGVSKKVYSSLDCRVFEKLWRWAYRRHPKKSKNWVMGKYWQHEKGKWQFGSPEGITLFRHDQQPIIRHIKVQGNRSPYDGDWIYWTARLGRNPMVSTRVGKLLKRQEGRCARCGLYFKDGDLPEVDHIIPKVRGGTDTYKNIQLLHRHCHDRKTAEDKLLVEGVYDNTPGYRGAG